MPAPIARSGAPSPLSSAAPSPKPPPSLVSRVLKSHLAPQQQQPATPPAAQAASATATPTRSSYTRPLANQDSTPRAQFEQQQDFIGFDASPPPRDSPRSHSKRTRDDYDDRDDDDEGSRRLQSRERNRSTPWCDRPGVDWDRAHSAIDQLNREAHAFVHYVSPSPQEHELRLWTIELIRRTIHHSYPDASIECFGSVGTSLYLPGGDIDLVLLSPSLPFPPLKPSASLLHRLASLLLTSGIAQPNSLVVIAKARVPIVKFVTRHGAFPVDLSVNQRGGVDAAVKVRSMLEEYAYREEGYVEPGLGVKGAAAAAAAAAAAGKGKAAKGAAKPKPKGKGKQREADSDVDSDDDIVILDPHSRPSSSEPEEGELPDAAADAAEASRPSSRSTSTGHHGREPEPEPEQHPVDHGVARSLVLLVKAFLGQRGMNEVFTGGLGSYSIICLVISFLQLHPKIQTATVNPNRNLGLLFVEFLELYGKHFNYDQAGITLRGRGGYFNKHDKGWYRPGQPYLLSIEDPNDPKNDVSGGSHAIIRVRQTLSGGFDVLTASLCARQSLLASTSSSNLARVPVLSASALPNADSSTSLDPSQRSLLGSIVGLGAAERLSRRAHAQLHADGVLQRLLEREEGAFAPLSGKALKRARRDERAGERRDKTIARLERKVEEREKRTERKRERRKRKAAEAEDDEGEDDAVEMAVEDAVVKANDLAPLAAVSAHNRGAQSVEDDGDDDSSGALFVVDVVGSTRSGQHDQAHAPPAKKARLSAATATSASDDEDEDDSRYARAHVRAKPTLARPAAAGVTHVTDDSSASSGSERDGGDGAQDEDEEGADVVLGGTGGDLVRPGGVVSRDSTPGTGSGSRSGAARRARKKQNELKAEKERRKNEYWAAKGPREEDE
ncbi:hypothetical protein JCM8208_006382 [Rhodotorula glutinis]